MRKSFFLTFLIIISIVFFLFPNSIGAQIITCPGRICPPGAICIQNPLCAQTFDQLINAIIDFIYKIAFAIAPLMIIIAGFYFVTAGGDPKRVETAKNIILYTCIGLAVILLAKGLVALLKQLLGVSP